MSEAKKLTNNVGAPMADNQQLRASAARAMGDAPEAIKRRHIENCAKADAAYGAGVAKALGM